MMRVLTPLVILASCWHPPAPGPTSDCSAAIAAFASADPARFRPLPASCTLDDDARTLHSLDTTTRGMLAKRSQAVTIRWFSSDKLPEIHAWIDASGYVVLLDADTPPGTAAAYMTALGKPDHELDDAYRGNTLEGAEKLWLSRGTVVVASPHSHHLVDSGLRASVASRSEWGFRR